MTDLSSIFVSKYVCNFILIYKMDISLNTIAEEKIVGLQNEEISAMNRPNSDNDLVFIDLFYPEIDTSESFRIRKILLKEESIQKLKTELAEKNNIVGVYGISSEIKIYLQNAFNCYIPTFPSREGIYFYYNRKIDCGALVFIAGNEEEYSIKPINSSTCTFITIIRILTDLSYTIVACLSQNLYDNWFYQDQGLSNPYNPKTHLARKITLKKVIIQESGTEKINVENDKMIKKGFFFTKDHYSQLFCYTSRNITEDTKADLKGKIEEFCQNLKTLNDITYLNLRLQEFYSKVDIFSFITESITDLLQKHVYLRISKQSESLNSFYKELALNLEKEFIFNRELLPHSEKSIILLENYIKKAQKDSGKELKELNSVFKNKIEAYLEIFKKPKISDIVSKYYDEYISLHQLDHNKIDDFYQKLCSDLENKINLKDKRPRMIPLFKAYLKDEMLNILKKLKDPTLLSKNKFLKLFEEKLNRFQNNQKDDIINEILSSNIQKYYSTIKNIDDKFYSDCVEAFGDFGANDLEFNLSTLNYSMESSGVMSKHKQHLEFDRRISPVIKKYLPEKLLSVSQIIIIESDVAFVFISNQVKQVTHVIRFKPKNGTKEDIEVCENLDDPDATMAPGSSSKTYIIYFPNKRKVNQGCLLTNKYLQIGLEIEIYQKVNKISSSYLMQKERKLFIIDDNGTLFCKHLIGQETNISEVKFISLNTSDKNLDVIENQKFIEIDVSFDEKIIFLRSDSSIICYDQNLIHTHIIPITNDFKSFNNIQHQDECYLIIIDKSSKVTCLKIIVPKKETKTQTHEIKEPGIDGNPIFDVHHLGFMKFGPFEEDTQVIRGKRSLYYYINNTDQIKILKYLNCLDSVKNNFIIGGYLGPESLFKAREMINKKDFLIAISVCIPIHIASVNQGNLIPLRNGVNHIKTIYAKEENDNFLNQLADYIRFGSYEEIIEKLEHFLVISIIGRQSSGKSYLLNRLAGTRFDVAAQRCTDGIWMSIGHIRQESDLLLPVIVFDCEGLFTVERSTQEEIKLCLFLSSLSDILILNSDLSSGKHILNLFDQFSFGVNRLKGENLFGGYLDITYRDIPNNQEKEAAIEFANFVQKLIDMKRDEIIEKIFSEDILNSVYHNFENSLFEKEVKQSREYYVNSDFKRKWIKTDNFGLRMKMILGQIFTDDAVNLDERMFFAKIRKFRLQTENIISDPILAKKELNDQVFKKTINLGEVNIEVLFKIREFYKDETNPLKFFEDNLEIDNYKNLIRSHHDLWYTQLDNLLKEFFELRKNLISNYYREKLPNNPDFQDQIDTEIIAMKSKLDKDAIIYNICLRKCKGCDFKCINFSDHKGDCYCGTDHICIQNCEICDYECRCGLFNGHSSQHICKKEGHKCNKPCEIIGCENTCTQIPFHEGKCKCSSFHPCHKECEMYYMCKQNCVFDAYIDHDQHRCNGKCPAMCIFEDDRYCSCIDHFHDMKISEEEIHSVQSNQFTIAKPHLCSNSHACKRMCEHEGICNIEPIFTEKKHSNPYNTFYYKYVDFKEIRMTCGSTIPIGIYNHENPKKHICNKLKHFCKSRCPECNTICDLNYGHDGFHSSDVHRNKDCSQYISTESIFKKYHVVKAGKNSDLKETSVTFTAGEPANPEICDQYCISKGQGHLHPWPCKGGSDCLEIVDQGFAVHSTQEYKSNFSESIFYDFVTCETYWKKQNWLPPNHKNPEQQERFNKCNSICNHNSHQERGEKVYCQLQILHSLSNNYCDHDFPCQHTEPNFNDIVFIVDCTGSMGDAFLEVHKVIADLIDKWGHYTNRFAFVGYTEHFPNNGDFPKENPVRVFPYSKQLEDGIGPKVADFIGNMKTSGGSRPGEALIDGLAEANKLQFRYGSFRMYILICDDTPHGDEFVKGSPYPNGCPCGYKWKDLLDFMKANNSYFIFVRLNELLNTTVELFKQYYGVNFKAIPLNGFEGIASNVFNTVSQKIENNFVFSNKLRNK